MSFFKRVLQTVSYVHAFTYRTHTYIYIRAYIYTHNLKINLWQQLGNYSLIYVNNNKNLPGSSLSTTTLGLNKSRK